MKTFQEVYKLPLKFDRSGDIVWTADNERAFDFPLEGDENAYMLTEFLMTSIVSKINGNKDYLHFRNLTYKDAVIYTEDGKVLIVIRGWGHLTGTGGGLALDEELAAKLQDDFAHFIIERLKD